MSVFIAIDVETANSARHSICEVGLAAFAHGGPLWQWQSIVNPEEPFEHDNIKIHGVTEKDTHQAPTFPQMLESITASLENRLIVCHSSFDFHAFHAAAAKYGISLPDCNWLDSYAVARLAWPELSSHGLKPLCAHFDIALEHHNAVSDAFACGEIVNRACLALETQVLGLLDRIGTIATPSGRPTQARKPFYSERIELSGRKDGPLAGHVLVCTGEMALGERKIAEMAATLGCDVEDTVTQKRTTILVTGYRDPLQYDNPKSTKQIAAENVIAKGKNITIMNETEFLDVAKRFGLVIA